MDQKGVLKMSEMKSIRPAGTEVPVGWELGDPGPEAGPGTSAVARVGLLVIVLGLVVLGVQAWLAVSGRVPQVSGLSLLGVVVMGVGVCLTLVVGEGRDR